MPLREKILHAATQLYAETGFRGTTTRQIAERAGVNEVTLFRHFGSKTALLHEAIQCACARRENIGLPERPSQIREELLQWAEGTWTGLWNRRAVIRTALGELAAHPELYPRENSAAACAGRELSRYLERVRATGLAAAEFDVLAATATLMGTLFADAMTRDILPFVYRQEPAQAIEQYVELFLRAIGVETPSALAQERR
ncbi:MAG TPA: helix-turn-helix domain-containing protein [Gemmatimonadales bacterium]|jgi:AcrR family transcriptional regulator|nr:helix-turn-helix domain-containing protein [Gemmatimonadales bacterium]